MWRLSKVFCENGCSVFPPSVVIMNRLLFLLLSLLYLPAGSSQVATAAITVIIMSTVSGDKAVLLAGMLNRHWNQGISICKYRLKLLFVTIQLSTAPAIPANNNLRLYSGLLTSSVYVLNQVYFSSRKGLKSVGSVLTHSLKLK